jgi:hypothetical protein
MTRSVAYDEVFETLAAGGAKTVLRRYFREDSCINSTRVLVEVFRALGLTASPFSVRAMVFSRGFVKRAGREKRMPESDAELHAWTTDPKVYSVGIGFGTIGMPKESWPGHLVLRVGHDHFLDATISQASRPARGIRMPDMLVVSDVPVEFWRGKEAVVRQTPDGSVVRYEPDPSNNGYIGSPAWSLRPGVEEAAYRDIMALL